MGHPRAVTKVLLNQTYAARGKDLAVVYMAHFVRLKIMILHIVVLLCSITKG